MKFGLALLAVAAAAVFLLSRGQAEAPKSIPQGARELRFCITSDPKTFDPLLAPDQNSELVRYITAGVLLRVNRATDALEPELAETWSVTGGGRAIQFKLRPGLRFSDGSPLTARDVERTLRTALDPAVGSPAGDSFRSAKGDPEIRVISDREVSIHYSAPKSGLDRLFDELAIASPARSAFPATAGPFHITGYRPGSFIQLQRNPNYWRRDAAGKQLPYLDSIRIDIQSNGDIELARFIRGELHLANRLAPDAFDRVAASKPDSARNLGSSLDSEFLWFNLSPSPGIPEWKRAWFRSSAFRHAISKALHREDLVRIVYRGHGRPAAGPFSPSNRFWFNSALKPLVWDGPGALRLLSQDGFTLRDGTLLDRAGHAVEFSLITQSGSAPRQQMAALIQDDLRKIGIRLNLAPLDASSFLSRITRSLDYEGALLGFSNVSPDPNEQLSVWLSSGPLHPWWPRQKTPAFAWERDIDRLMLAQAAESSRELRKKSFDEVQKIVADQEPLIYLVNPDSLVGISPRIRGAQPSPLSPHILWNIEHLQLD